MRTPTYYVLHHGIKIAISPHTGIENMVLKEIEIKEDEKVDILGALENSLIWNVGDGLALGLPVHVVAFLSYDQEHTDPKEDAWDLTYYQHLETNEREVYQNQKHEFEKFTVEWLDLRKKSEEQLCADSIFKVWGILEDLGMKQIKECDTCLVYENSLIFFKGIDSNIEKEAMDVWYRTVSSNEVLELLKTPDFEDFNSYEDPIRKEAISVLQECIKLRLLKEVTHRQVCKSACLIMKELSTKDLPKSLKDFVHESLEKLDL